mgnify:CR=1 FL=1
MAVLQAAAPARSAIHHPGAASDAGVRPLPLGTGRRGVPQRICEREAVPADDGARRSLDAAARREAHSERNGGSDGLHAPLDTGNEIVEHEI